MQAIQTSAEAAAARVALMAPQVEMYSMHPEQQRRSVHSNLSEPGDHARRRPRRALRRQTTLPGWRWRPRTPGWAQRSRRRRRRAPRGCGTPSWRMSPAGWAAAGGLRAASCLTAASAPPAVQSPLRTPSRGTALILASRMTSFAQEKGNCAALTILCAVSWFSCTSIGQPCLYFVLQARPVAGSGLSVGMPMWSHWRFGTIAMLPSGHQRLHGCA